MFLFISRRYRLPRKRESSTVVLALAGFIWISKSVYISPLSARIFRLALTSVGNVTSTSPLSDVNAIGLSGGGRFREGTKRPFTGCATTEPEKPLGWRP